MNKPRKATQFRWQKRFWTAHIPITVALYFFWPHVFAAVSVLYLVLLSQWTQRDNLDGAEQAADAARQDGKNGE